MGAEKYSLEKIKIGGEVYRLVVRTDGDNVSVIYNGQTMSVAGALKEIYNEIESLKSSGGGAVVDLATDEEVKEMLDEVFGARRQ